MCSINHDLKAIYLHIPKTGGSYISSILSQYYGFKNYYLKRPDHNQFTKIVDNSVDKHENKIFGTYLYYSSSPHLNKIMNMNPQKWKNYKIFSFVREPYQKLLSGFHYIQQKNHYKNIDFKTFCLNYNKINCWSYWHCFMPQISHLINEKNENVCFMIGKQEFMEKDLKIILETFGLTIIHTPFIKNKSIKNKNNKIDHQFIKNIIKPLLIHDYHHFDYDFDFHQPL